MTQFARLLSVTTPYTGIDRIVVDEAGLRATYDFDVQFAPISPDMARALGPEGVPPFVTVLQQQLGLRLQPARGAIDVLVIEHIEEPAPD